jgi:hypothetical protein
MLANPTGESETVHSAAQPSLRKDYVDLLSRAEYSLNVSGRDAFENPISTAAQIACDGHPDQDVGFDDQNYAWCSAVSALVI